MRTVRLGNSGLQLTQVTFGSALTIGTEKKDLEYAQSMIDTAWDLGIRSFDCSNNYGNGLAEVLLGAALKKYPREEFVLATKGSWPIGDTCYHKGLSRKHILWAFEESLKRLDYDYVDVYYAHRYDYETPMEEIVRVFNYLISVGRIRYWATSEWPASAIIECLEVCDKLNLEKPVLEQCLFSFAVTKALHNGVADACNKHKIGMLGFSPLCQGLLTGKYQSGIPENSRVSKSAMIDYDKTLNFYQQNKERIDGFLKACEKHGVNTTGAALNWNLNHSIFPVIGASTPQQLVDNINAISIPIHKAFWSEVNQL